MGSGGEGEGEGQVKQALDTTPQATNKKERGSERMEAERGTGRESGGREARCALAWGDGGGQEARVAGERERGVFAVVAR